ncbi:MAG: hypothetical protein AAB366_01150 [Patescibacteria group bacterium]
MKSLILVFHAFRDLLIRHLPNLREKENSFAFLVHPRDTKDVYRKYPFAEYLPENMLYN